MILAKMYSLQKSSTFIFVIKNTKERESVLKNTQTNARQKKYVPIQNISLTREHWRE